MREFFTYSGEVIAFLGMHYHPECYNISASMMKTKRSSNAKTRSSTRARSATVAPPATSPISLDSLRLGHVSVRSKSSTVLLVVLVKKKLFFICQCFIRIGKSHHHHSLKKESDSAATYDRRQVRSIEENTTNFSYEE